MIDLAFALDYLGSKQGLQSGAWRDCGDSLPLWKSVVLYGLDLFVPILAPVAVPVGKSSAVH